jgi:5,10-methylenetetrahydromethanopterin reductase
MTPAVGLAFQSDKDPDDYVRLARLAEDAGVDVLSVYGDFGYQPPIVALTLMATATRRVRLGPACLNPYSLAPLEIAGQVAALDLVSDGRAYLGIARGAWLDSVGIAQKAPATTLREAIEVCRRLMSGDTEGYEGDVFRLAPGTRLTYRAVQEQVPVMVGTWGPRTLELAGEVADEVKVGGSANPDVVPWVRERIARGATRRGRPLDDIGVCLGAVTVVAEDGQEARRLAKREVAMYLAVVGELDPTTELPDGLLGEIRESLERDDLDTAAQLIPDDILARFAFAGTPAEVARQAISIFEAGATRVEFGTPHGITPDEGVRLIGEHVIPRLRQREWSR